MPVRALRRCTWFCILTGLQLVAFDTRAEDSADADRERIRAVRATYEAVPPTILQIKEPLTVLGFSDDKLGNAISLNTVDANGTKHHFTWKAGKNADADRTSWRHWQGNRLPIESWLWPVRGPEEAALYGLLLRWESQHKQIENPGILDESQRQWVAPFLDNLDQRFAAEKPLLQK